MASAKAAAVIALRPLLVTWRLVNADSLAEHVWSESVWAVAAGRGLPVLAPA